MVIAIISVLASLLLPSLDSARQSALSAACLSQLKQIGATALMYAGDHHDYFPPGRWGNKGATASANTWYSNLTPYIDSSKSLVTNVWQLSKEEQKDYNRAWQDMTCPAERNRSNLYFYQGVQRTYGIHLGVYQNDFPEGYGIQSWHTPTTRKTYSIYQPATTMLFCDSREVDYIYSTLWDFCVRSDQIEKYMPPRHNGNYNGVFTDGHAEDIPAETMHDPGAQMWKATRQAFDQ